MSDVAELRDTIVPKSDQLNADDLLAGPITVRITGVKRGSADQPVEVHIEGRQPYKPCKSMRRVLISAWGDDGRVWIGRSMTLFADPAVKFGGVQVGGIRISHLSDLESDLSLQLTATRGKRSPFLVRRLVAQAPKPSPKQAAIERAKDAGRAAAGQGIVAFGEWMATLDQRQREYLSDFITEQQQVAERFDDSQEMPE